MFWQSHCDLMGCTREKVDKFCPIWNDFVSVALHLPPFPETQWIHSQSDEPLRRLWFCNYSIINSEIVRLTWWNTTCLPQTKWIYPSHHNWIGSGNCDFVVLQMRRQQMQQAKGAIFNAKSSQRSSQMNAFIPNALVNFYCVWIQMSSSWSECNHRTHLQHPIDDTVLSRALAPLDHVSKSVACGGRKVRAKPDFDRQPTAKGNELSKWNSNQTSIQSL